jgi:peptide/nickel transport system substrate-binding protein
LTGSRRRTFVAAVVVAAAVVAWSPWSAGPSRSAHQGLGAGSTTSTGRRSAGEGHGQRGAPSTAEVGREGGVVRLGLAGPIVVDPPYASPASPSDQMVLDLLYDGLTEVRTSEVPPTATGRLAESWTVDAAQRVWRFTLAQATTFSSGRPIVGADVVASLTHVIAGGDASPAALRLELVQGFRDYLDGRSPSVAGLRAPDDRTVEIRLDAPLAQLPLVLAAPAYGIVDVRALAAIGSSAPAAGPTGTATPAQMAGLPLTGRWQVGTGGSGAAHLVRRAAPAPEAPPAHLDGVDLHPYVDDEAAYDAFDGGHVDWAPVPHDRYGEAVRAHGDEAFAPFQAELLLGLRVDRAPLSDPRLRQAIAHALDRQAIVRTVYPDHASRLDTIVPVPLGGPGDRPAAGPGYDRAEARRLLAEAYPDGHVPTIHLDHEASAATTALMRVVAGSLRAVGIPTSVQPRSLDDYQRLLVSGQQQVFTLSWLGGYRSADAYLDPLLRSSSADNLLGLRDPEVDGALTAARSAPDAATMVRREHDAEDLALAQAVVIPLAQFRTEVVVAPTVLGLRQALDGTVDWAAVRLSA